MHEDGEADGIDAADRTKVPDPSPHEDRPATAPRRRRMAGPRRVIAWILVVLASLLVPLSVVTAWTVGTVTQTDQYVSTLAPLVRERVITDYVAAQATKKLFATVDVHGRIEHALPKRAEFLATPVTRQLYGFVYKQVNAVLRSEWFHKLWDRLNERSHNAVVNVLTGKVNASERAHKVIVDVTPVITKAIDALDARGVTVFDGVRTRLRRADTLTVNLATSKQISKARNAFAAIYNLGWAVPVLAGIVVVAGVAVAVDRRKTLLRMSIGTALFAVFLLAALLIGRTFFVNHAVRVTPSVTSAVFDTIVRFLRDWLRITVVVAAALAIVLWLAGPGRWPRWIRAKVALAARWTARRVAELGNETRRRQASAAARSGAGWVMEHRDGLRLVGVVVAGAVIVLGGNLSVDGVFWTAVGLAVYLVVLEVVVAWARRASVEAIPGGSTPGGSTPGGASPGRGPNGGKGPDRSTSDRSETHEPDATPSDR
jgi:hypothetical protein